MAAYGGQDDLWQPQIRAIVGADNNGGNAALEGFIPLKQTAESVLFLDVRAKHDFKDGSGQDVGLGIRRIVNPDLMLGGYAYLNVENWDDHQFTAATLGAEAITPHFDAHVNVFVPIKGDSTDNSVSSTLSMVGNQLLEQIAVLDRRDYAAWGIEGEIGAQVPVNLPENHSLRIDVGGYHFEDPHGDDPSVTGAKAGLEYTIGNVFGSGTSLVFTGEVRDDNRDHTQFAGSVRLTIPFNPGHGTGTADSGPESVYPVSEGLRKRVNERVRGDIGVRVQTQDLTAGSTTRVAINAATGQAFGSFFFANGNNTLGTGTIGNPTTLDDAVTKAGGGYVVALGGNGDLKTAGVTLANGETIIGGGESVTAQLFGGGTRTFNLGGSDGTIQGTNSANNVITLGNGNTLNGITVTGGADGIFGNNINGATLTNVTVDAAGGNGAEFTGTSTGVNASGFTAQDNGLDGLHIVGDGTYNFTGTTLLSGNGGDGLDITGHGTYNFATVNAENNAGYGILVQGTSVSGSFTTTGGTVSGNGVGGVSIDPITAHVVLDSISQSGGTSGVVLDNVSGSFTVNGSTTVSGTSGSAIAISNSPASIRFGDVSITTPVGDGISFAGVNAAVVAGNIVISGLGLGHVGLDFSGSQTTFTGQSVNITGTGAAGSIGIDLAKTTGDAAITITNGGTISNVDFGVRFGVAGSLANSADAEFTFGGGSISGVTASLDARGLNQTLGHYAFGSTTFTGTQLFDAQNIIFVGAAATGSGTGSSLLDLASIATADANTSATAIFVLVNDASNTPIDDNGGFTLSAGQTLASFGNGRTFTLGGIPANVTGTNIQHSTTVSSANGAATLTNSGSGDVVTLASNTSLLDLNISGGSGNGVHGSGVTGVTISGLSVSGAGLNGLLFDGTNGITATNLSSTGNGGAGLSLQGPGSYTFNGTTTLSNNTGNGLLINGNGTYTFATLDAQGNHGSGVSATSTGTGKLTTTGGTISGNGTSAFSATSIGLDVTLDSISQTAASGTTGVSLAGVSGNFTVSGTTTISNTTLDGISITGSSATIGFDGDTTITKPAGNGVTLNGNSGAVTFGKVTIDQPGLNGIDVSGVNGSIGFGDIGITNLAAGKTGLDLSGSTSTFMAASLDITGAAGSTGIDLSGTSGGSVTIDTGVISAGTGVQMGKHGAAGARADTTFSFGGGSITGSTASIDMIGMIASSGTYAFHGTTLTGPQLFDAPNIIFVGAASTGAGDGSSVDNLISASLADSLTTASNAVFVLVKTAAVQTINTDANGFNLANGQSIVSFANGATVSLGAPPTNVTGTNVVTSAVQQDPFGFGGATLNNSAGSAIDLANGNLVENLSVSNSSSGAAIDGSAGITGLTVSGVTIVSAVTGIDLTGAAGTIGITNLTIQAAQTGIVLKNSAATATFTDTTVGGVTGTGLSLDNYSGTGTFDNFDITGAGTGVSISGGSTGTLTFDAASSIANTTGVAFNIDTATPNLTFNGTIDQTNAASAVKINAMTGGSATFAGLVTASTSTANAIVLTGNTGGTISFTGGLNIDTTSGTGFTATGGGTIGVTATSGDESITTDTGQAINLDSVTIGAGGVSFDSIKTGVSAATALNFNAVSGGTFSGGAVTVGGTGGTADAISIVNSPATFTFASATIDGSSRQGIHLSGGNGAVTFTTVDIDNTNSNGIDIEGATGNVTITGGTVGATTPSVTGFGVYIANQTASSTIALGTLAVTGANADTLRISNSAGTITMTGGSLTQTGTSNALSIIGGTGSVSTAATIAQSGAGQAVAIDGTSGDITISGNITASSGGNIFDIGSSTAPTGGTITFSGSQLKATGGGGAVIAGLGAGATFNATAPLSITNATGNGLSVSNVAGSATFGTVTISGSGGNGIEIAGNAGAVTFGPTTVTLGTAANTAGIDFSGTNANITFGTTTINSVGANQTGVDFSSSATTAGFGLTTITGTGALTSRGIDLSSTTGDKVITFLRGSDIEDVGIGVDLSSGQTTATSANATFTFGDGTSADGLQSKISAATGGFTVNTIGLDPTLGDYNFNDVAFTGNANLASAPGAVTLVSQSGGFIAAGTTGNLSMGVNTISLAAAEAMTGTQTFAFIGPINLGAGAFTLDSGQTITGFGNGNVVSFGTIQPANVHGNLGATGGNVTGDEAVVTGAGDFIHLLGDNAVRNTAFNFSGATGSTFLVDQGAAGFSNAGGITIEGVTVSNVAAGQTVVKVLNLDTSLSIINNNINVAGTLLDVSGGAGTITVSRGTLPNSTTAGTLTGGGIDIAGRTGGAVTFTDQVTITGGNGVSISGGTAAGAVNFNGGLDITTSAATGLDFSGLNVLTVANAGSTTINATGQTALSLRGTIGAGGVHFDSVTSTNAAGQGVLISGASGGNVDLGTVNVTASGSAGIEILNSTGTYTFGNTTINNSASAGRGVNIENASNTTTATFNGTLDITTSTGTGFRVASTAAPANTAVNITGSGARTITTSNGTAVDITSATVNGAFTSVSATFSAGNGINLQNLAGTLDLGSGALTNTGSGAAFNVGSATNQSGGNATISYAGTIASNGSGAAVSIQELTGGSVTLSGNLTDGSATSGGQIVVANINNGTAASVTFSGTSKQISSGTNDAVSLTGNTNGTINFTNGGLVINTTSGTGFSASGGTVTVTGSGNTITTTSGTALNLNGAAIGAGGMNFDSVSANGAATGISLTSVAGPGAIDLGTVNLQGITSRGVDVSTSLGAALTFTSLTLGLNSSSAVAFDLNGAAINAAITANDFHVTNAAAAGTSIGVDLSGATGGQTVQLGDTNPNGNSSSIAGVNTGVLLSSTTNLAFTYGDGESVVDQGSTISANFAIDATSAPTLGTYNFKDVNFQANPGKGFGLGKIYFVGASATGDGSGRDQSNLATLSTAEAAAVSSDILVLVNNGTITAAGTNGDNTLTLLAGEQVRGFGNGNINLALTVPSTIQLANSSISIADQTAGGAATLTTSAGNTAITLGASGNIIDGFILNGSSSAAVGIAGTGTSGATISNMTIQNFTTAALQLNNISGTTTLTNLAISGSGTGISFGGASGPAGTVTGTNVDITGGSGISVTGGNAAISFDANSSITSTSGTAVSVANRGGGSFGFAGTVTANGGASGINISGATAANTVNFTGTVNLGTTTVMTGTAVVINNNSTASTIGFSNLNIASSGTTGFSASNGGTVNVTTGTVSSTGAQAVNLNGVATTTGINFTSTTSTGGTNNVALTNVTGAGTVSLGSGSLTGASGAAFLVSGGSANLSYGGSITKTTAGNVVSISSRTGGTTTLSGNLSATGAVANGILVNANTGGTINFSGNSKTLSTGANNAVSITSNNGATVNFTNGGLVITTTSGIGFNATGSGPAATTGGTITVQGTGNSITSTTGTALNVVNTSIGSGNLTFQSISSDGAANGIVLNNTGLGVGNGGLVVTGTGTTAGTGGTIQNAVQGALFTSTQNLSLSNMNFTNANSGNGTLNNIDGPTFNSAAQAAINMSSVSTATFTNLNLNGGAQVGINGQNVSNLSIANTTITGFGDAVLEGDMRFYNLTGTSSITNSTFTFAVGAGGDNLVDIRNDSGTTLTLNVAGSTFSNTRNSANGAQGLNFEAFGNANATLNISNSTFSNLKTSGVEGFARGTSTLNVNITDGGVAGNGNTFDTGGTTAAFTGRAIGLNAQDTAQLNFNINRNKKIYGFGGPVINIYAQDNANIQGRIDNNADIENNSTGSNYAGSPIYIHPQDNATGVVEVIGNTIINNGQDAAISAGVTGDGISKFSASLDITIQNNNITMAGYNTGANTFNDAILLSPGALAADLTTMYANLQNNTISGITAANGAAAFVNENTGGAGSHLYLEGFTTDTATTWANRGNTPGASVIEANSPGSAAIPVSHNSGHVKTPTNPNQ